MNLYRNWLALIIALTALYLPAQEQEIPQSKSLVTAPKHFVCIPLGVSGGLHEENLSAYLLASAGSSNFICLDAGTLSAGLRKASSLGAFSHIKMPIDSTLTFANWFLQQKIKAYLISHTHMDHIAGLIINSPVDGYKHIVATQQTIDHMKKHIFNWEIWANFADEGIPPLLKKYSYVTVQPGNSIAIPGVNMRVEPFMLSHAGGPSTAFLVEAAGFYALYFGDTGPDAVEKSNALSNVWKRIAPLVRNKKLRGMLLEVSYADGRPDKLLFGHLTPAWMMAELRQLARWVNPKAPNKALSDLKIIVTHIKPATQKGIEPVRQITQQLQARNDLGCKFIIARQGERIKF